MDSALIPMVSVFGEDDLQKKEKILQVVKETLLAEVDGKKKPIRKQMVELNLVHCYNSAFKRIR
eukprot:CAMPEP_0113948058 /NCGR_PEP_ID=MMETSP1339-20121228/68236_1 /TAXON_ID=94617 /ORGANISM="Fibrocapsa japonica" /LENGTH=63 /DNA_ID=CAMNT_0000954931 /DNA_START=55 /DNA_END=242 /DNA_ORIENTATION=+ /assembly_acc=CAM_ASM_000762